MLKISPYKHDITRKNNIYSNEWVARIIYKFCLVYKKTRSKVYAYFPIQIELFSCQFKSLKFVGIVGVGIFSAVSINYKGIGVFVYIIGAYAEVDNGL